MDELADSSALLPDAGALRARLAADGYLFFRGLLPADSIRQTGETIAGRLHDGGWVAGAAPKAAEGTTALADPAFRGVMASADFNRLPYLPPLRTAVRRVLGEQAFSYPVKVLRVVYPERQLRTKGRYVHCDYGVTGVQDMLTSWIPLMDIPAEIGGLAVRPGGHLGRPHWPHPLRAAARGWATTSYRPGDAIVFHCLTPHAALPNTGTGLRLSADFRWQRPDQPAPAEFVYGPGGRQRELLSLLLRWRRWWEPVPPGLAVLPKQQLLAAPPGPSQLFAVHPGWRRWRPPRGEVH